MFKISYVPSKSHWLFPPIIMGILVILLIAMVFQRFMRKRKAGDPFIDFKNARFFEKNWDKVRLLGTLVLFVLYIFAMDLIGFLAASILFVFLFNILYVGIDRLATVPAEIKAGTFLSGETFRSLLVSLAVSIVFSVVIWYLFGRVFKITLP